LKPGVHSGRQPEPRQVVGDLKFDRDHSGHEDLPSADSNLILPGRASERILFHDRLGWRGAWDVGREAWSVEREDSRQSSVEPRGELAMIEKCQNKANSLGR
jgi:hypothetical protein